MPKQQDPKGGAVTPDKVDELFDELMPEMAKESPKQQSQKVQVVKETEDLDDNYEPPDPDEEPSEDLDEFKIVEEAHRASHRTISEQLQNLSEDEVVYRSKYKGFYLSIPTREQEDTIIAGNLTKRMKKIRCQFKQHLFTTDDPEVIEAIDKYIEKFRKRKMISPVMRLDDYQKQYVPTAKTEAEIIQDMDFRELEEIYLKRQREIKGEKQIKKGTIKS